MVRKYPVNPFADASAETEVEPIRERWHSPPEPVQRKETTLARLAYAFFWLFVFAIPWENALILPGLGTVSRLLGLVALPVGLLAILDSGRLRVPSAPLILMALFVVWGSLSYWWTVDPEATTTLTVSWIQYLGMVWLIWELAPQREKLLGLMQAYVFGTVISAGDTVLTYLSGNAIYYQRYAGSGFDPNDLGLILALSLPISFYLVSTQKRGPLVWIYFAQQIIALVAIALTSSRGAVIATLVALLFVPLSSARMSFRQKGAFLLLGVIAISCALIYLPESSWKRLGGISAEIEEGTWNSRKLIWSVGLELFEDHPLRGVGAGGFSASLQRVLAIEQVAHNTFLSVLIEEGLIGFSILLLSLMALVLPALRLPALERNLWLVLLATWGAGVSTLTWENRKPTWFVFGLLAAWLATAAPFVRRKGPRPELVHRLMNS